MGAQLQGRSQAIGQIAFDDGFPGSPWNSSMISISMTV